MLWLRRRRNVVDWASVEGAVERLAANGYACDLTHFRTWPEPECNPDKDSGARIVLAALQESQAAIRALPSVVAGPLHPDWKAWCALPAVIAALKATPPPAPAAHPPRTQRASRRRPRCRCWRFSNEDL